MQKELVGTLTNTLVEGRRATAQKFDVTSDETVFAEGELGRTKEVCRGWWGKGR